jgi:hypothetical protein
MKSPEDLTKHTLFLRSGDFKRLQALYPDIGASVVIRKIVSNFLDKDRTPVVEAQLEIDL